jgi:LmbE family N-acetylglucosaminyl deacetylase
LNIRQTIINAKLFARGSILHYYMDRSELCRDTPLHLAVIAPHPDDETFAAGGLIAKARASGTVVHIIFMTRGEGSHHYCCSASRDEIGRRRFEHARRAADALGVKQQEIYCLNLPDGGIPHPDSDNFDKAAESLARLLRNLKPRQVYCPHPLDAWPDHIATEEIVRLAVKKVEKLGTGTNLYYYLVWGWYKARFAAIPRMGWDRAIRLDIRAVLDKKKHAAQEYLLHTVPGCGIPYTGDLPKEIVGVCDNPYELFFRAKNGHK